jgi:hypothetical protein
VAAAAAAAAARMEGGGGVRGRWGEHSEWGRMGRQEGGGVDWAGWG